MNDNAAWNIFVPCRAERAEFYFAATCEFRPCNEIVMFMLPVHQLVRIYHNCIQLLIACSTLFVRLTHRSHKSPTVILTSDVSVHCGLSGFELGGLLYLRYLDLLSNVCSLLGSPLRIREVSTLLLK